MTLVNIDLVGNHITESPYFINMCNSVQSPQKIVSTLLKYPLASFNCKTVILFVY